MTSTENKAKTENDVKQAGEETWKCDGDTLKGEDSVMFFPYRKSVLDWKPVQC